MDRLIDRKAQFAIELERLFDTPLDQDSSKKNNGPGGIMGMLENALQNPEALRGLLANPMVSQMARTNPGIVESAIQSPQAQAALQAHPEMRQQLEGLLGRSLPNTGGQVTPAAAAQSPSIPQTYDAQLMQLSEMGFIDR